MRHLLSAFNVAAVSLAVPALGHAQTPPPAPVIHACYVPLTGTVYRIDETGLHQGCTSPAHVQFSWTDGAGAARGTDALTGDLGGTLAFPTVVGLRGRSIATTAPAAGQVLTFDGTKWGPAAATVTNGTVAGSFLATGTLGSGTIPATGSGERMMWYPAKAALRAGSVVGSDWDDANVGLFSVATGLETVASGRASTAFGAGSTASGEGSAAVGESNLASGAAAIAMGINSQATGAFSTAIGDGNVASGFASAALGASTEASGPSSTAIGNRASTNLKLGSFVYGDASSGTIKVLASADNQFVVRAQHMWFGTNNNVTATDGRFLETSTGAFLSSGGVWTNVSDVNRKNAFRPVSGEDILAHLAAMPVQEWSYKAEDPSIRHLGPTAQDFYAAFHLGASNTSIGTIDADGVSLAAIKALEQRTRDLKSENAQLRNENERLTERLDAIEATLAALGAAPRVP